MRYLFIQLRFLFFIFFFFFNDTATTEIYTLSLHDALPISRADTQAHPLSRQPAALARGQAAQDGRSEEHTSELQSQSNLVCRLLLEKKKKKTTLSINCQMPFKLPSLYMTRSRSPPPHQSST